MENLGRIGKWVAAAATVLLFLFACGRKEMPDLESRLLSLPAGFPPMPYPADNEFSMARWDLGKKLFFDPVLSVDSTLSCGSRHHPELAFADNLALSPGVQNRPGKTNAPSLANVGYHPYLLREGGLSTLEMQILVPIQEENEFAHNIVDISYQLQADTAYVRMSKAAYGRIPDPFVITRSISTFERSLISGNSPYDRYANQQQQNAFTAAQVRGKDLFFGEKAQCGTCHGGFNFTDYSFQNNGLYEVYDNAGRMRQTGDTADLALFKVPSLRNAALTAPYMHDGSIGSLEAVIAHYDAGGMNHPHKSERVRPLGLSAQEKQDLLAFLELLTDMQFVREAAFRP